MLNRGALVFAAAFTTLSSFHSPMFVNSHGYLKTPRSRNYYANSIISTNECPGTTGCPPPEYCPHCLNRNSGVCGTSSDTKRVYETMNWLDKSGAPMPWRSQNGMAFGYEESYVEGGTITLRSYLDTHHNGHMEARVCVVRDASSCTTPADFAGKDLIFDSDLALGGHPPMPKDTNYPGRGMFAGGQGGSIKEFAIRFKLPMGIYGEKILLQWKYITANSCSPAGYTEYFMKNSHLPSSYWVQGLSTCTTYPNDGSVGDGKPEQFFNCAEISIRPGGPPSPLPPTPTVPTPPPSPTTENTIQIQAENYLYMQGVQIEDTSDVNGGKNVGYIDTGDWMSYPEVMIPSTGTYRVEYRVASGSSGGGSLQLEKAGGTQVYGTVGIQNTGGWQTWQTVSHTVTLNAGPIAFGIKAIGGGWNINWFRITMASSPTTSGPTTRKPSSKPTTRRPSLRPTSRPTNKPTTTTEPTTTEPTTNEPSTNEPTTNEPTTNEPTTNEPTTNEPTTNAPTTHKPTSKPTTRKPTTRKPTSSKPTTRKPTSKPATAKPIL